MYCEKDENIKQYKISIKVVIRTVITEYPEQWKDDIDDYLVAELKKGYALVGEELSEAKARELIDNLKDNIEKDPEKYKQVREYYRVNKNIDDTDKVAMKVAGDIKVKFGGMEDIQAKFREIVPQVKEIMSNYGDVFLAWFDMPLDSTKEQSEELYKLVKRLQPNCLINSRLGNGKFDYVSLGDNEIPDSIPKDISENINENDIWGFKKSPYGLYESACTLNNSWGYSSIDDEWKNAETIFENRIKLEKLGINYLINVGLDWLGRIPYKAEEILKEVQKLYEERTIEYNK